MSEVGKSHDTAEGEPWSPIYTFESDVAKSHARNSLERYGNVGHQILTVSRDIGPSDVVKSFKLEELDVAVTQVRRERGRPGDKAFHTRQRR